MDFIIKSKNKEQKRLGRVNFCLWGYLNLGSHAYKRLGLGASYL